MEKILLICSSEKGIKVYTDNLKSMGYTDINVETNGAAARRKMFSFVGVYQQPIRLCLISREFAWTGDLQGACMNSQDLSDLPAACLHNAILRGLQRW